MNNARPSHIAVEIALACETIEEKNQRHRVWITRAGEVLTPDHESESELVVNALGGKMLNPCSYWKDIPRLVNGAKSESSLENQDISTWELTSEAFWNKPVVWVFLSGLVGRITHLQIDPELALVHAKIYQKYRNQEVFDISGELEYLQTPWKRNGGYRKHTATPDTELELMMQTGLPVNRVASAIALGLTHESTTRAMSILKHNHLPTDYVLNLAYLLPPERLVKLLTEMTDLQIKNLPVSIANFQNNSSEILDQDIEKYFLENN